TRRRGENRPCAQWHWPARMIYQPRPRRVPPVEHQRLPPIAKRSPGPQEGPRRTDPTQRGTARSDCQTRGAKGIRCDRGEKIQTGFEGPEVSPVEDSREDGDESLSAAFALESEDIRKTFGHFTALGGVTLRVKRGEFLALF